MLIWLLTLIGIVIIYLIVKDSKNNKKDFLVLSGIWITLILGSRYFINGFTDEITYSDEYMAFSKLSFNDLLSQRWQERDFGFYIVYWSMSQLFPWRQFPIYFITGFFIFAAFRFIYRNSDYPFISVLLLFVIPGFSFYMAAYRQCFATCFCLFAFEYGKEKKFFRYAIMMAIACSMHLSAVIFIPVYWLLKIKNNNIGRFLWVVGLVVVWVAENAIMSFASDVAGRDYTQAQEFSLVGFAIQIIIMLAPFILDLLGISYWHEGEKNKRLLGWILVSIGLLFYFSKLYNYSFERVSYYYSLFTIIALANTCARAVRNRGETLFINNSISVIITLLLIMLIIWRVPKDLSFFFLV